jgi:threonine/homoserine/homoserine lactone efflux protein
VSGLLDLRLLAYVGVVTLLIIVPGPDMALVARNSVRGGSRLVTPTVLGVATGSLGWGAASTLGVATLLQRSATLFSALRIVGALYLLLLGVSAMRSAWRGGERHRARGEDPAPRSRGSALAQGMLGNLLNPKAGVIFVTVLPQFLRPGDPPARAVLMMAIFEIALITWLLVYGHALARIGASRLGGRLRRGLEGASGAVLCGLGVEVAWETWRRA